MLAAWLVALALSGYDAWYYDADRYWALGLAFGPQDGFSLLAYRDPLRGYSFPLALRGLRGIAAAAGVGELAAVRLANAVLAAGLGTLVVPRLVRAVAPRAAVTLPRVLAFNALVLLFWRDHLAFPLSDVPAVALAAVALVLALDGRRPALLAAGAAAGLAYNVRPAYQLFVLALVVLVVLRARAGAGRRAVAGALVLTGAVCALVPQIAINARHFDTLAPAPARSAALVRFQLTSGLQLQKYETSVQAGRDPRLFYADPATQAVLDDEGPVTGLADYAGLVLEHPLTMAGAFLRRAFNGMDVQYATPYVRDPEADRSGPRSLVLYSLLFAGLALLLAAVAAGRAADRCWLVGAVVLVPCLGAVPSAVEPRFFLPAHLLLYASVVFAPGLGARLRALRGPHRAALALAWLLVVLACLALSGGTLGQLADPAEVTLPAVP